MTQKHNQHNLLQENADSFSLESIILQNARTKTSVRPINGRSMVYSLRSRPQCW